MASIFLHPMPYPCWARGGYVRGRNDPSPVRLATVESLIFFAAGRIFRGVSAANLRK